MYNYAKPLRLTSAIIVTNLFSAHKQTYLGDFKFNGERHNFWELNYVVDGSVGITCEDKIYKCVKGDIVIHPPKHFHTCWNSRKAKLTLFTIAFETEFPLFFPSLMVHGSDEERDILDSLIKCVGKKFSSTENMFFYQEKKFNLPEYHSDDKYEGQIIKNYLEILLLRLLKRKDIFTSTHISDKDASKYATLMLYLKNNVDNDLTIAKISNDLLESVSNLKRIFHKYMNVGIMKYYNDLRVERAIRYLESGLNVSAVSEKMNFSSLHYFSYFFKTATGVCPSKYLSTLKTK